MRTDDQIKQLMREMGTWFTSDYTMERTYMSQKNYPYKHLFQPIHINKLLIKNRLVMGPMGNASMSDETGKPSIKLLKYFEARAKGGVGLIISGMIPVDYKRDPSVGDIDGTGIFPRIDSHRSNLGAWKSIAEICHGYGTRFFLQLSPGMGRVGNPECLLKKKRLPVSSSWHKNYYMPEVPCRPLRDGEIDRIIKATCKAAADAKSVGIDGIQLHGHSGYLIEQMTDPAFNKRKWGKYKKAETFGIELVKGIRQACGEDFPIYYRIDLTLALHETYGKAMKEINVLKPLENGRMPEDTLSYMKNLVRAGVDAFDIDIGGYENWWLPHPPNPMPPGVYVKLAQRVKDYMVNGNILSNKGYKVPIIAVGKLGFPDIAEEAISKGYCDMIALGRPLLADPEWPNKVQQGRVEEICPCIGDHEGCLGQFASAGYPHCAVNPMAGFEEIYECNRKIMDPKKVAVVGAGPAGVMAAIQASKRGHHVHLYDKDGRIGGALTLGSVPRIKYEVRNYLLYLRKQVQLAQLEGLLEFIPKSVSLEDLDKQYDTIIFATGSVPKRPPISGLEDNPHIFTYKQALEDVNCLSYAKDILVVGGGDIGCEVAHYLLYEKNKRVSVIEMGNAFMPNTCTSNRGYMLHHLIQGGATLYNNTLLKVVQEKQALVSRNHHKNVSDPYSVWKPLLPENISNPLEKKIGMDMREFTIEYDALILCTGLVENHGLFKKAMEMGISNEVYNIGDAFTCGRVLEAVRSGFQVGNAI